MACTWGSPARGEEAGARHDNQTMKTSPPAVQDNPFTTVLDLSQSMLRDVVGALGRIQRVNQTIHLLSLNARVEAARAAEAGRGFAVVADALTGLSAETGQTVQQLEASSRRTASELGEVARRLSQEVQDERLCDLARNAIDLVDRNLYERSCDVRWWATDSALVDAAASPTPERCAHAARRLGQILDSYTVYADLLLCDLQGRVLANGRPQQWPDSVGQDMARSTWFRSALAKRSGDEFGFESVHPQPLIGGERALVYACTVRAGGQVHGQPLGVLGIVFRWDALGPQVLRALPLSTQEWAQTRAVIVDDGGRVLADAQDERIGQHLEFAGRRTLLKAGRGTLDAAVDDVPMRICHARSQGFETYATGWHALLLRRMP